MGRRNASLNSIAPRRIRVQAAAWVTELHSPDRSAQLEETVRRWIAQDPRHAAAFGLATEAWQRSGDLPAILPKPAPVVSARRARIRWWQPTLTGAAILSSILVAAAYYLREPTLVSGSGEQRTLSLADGSQVTLNARSALRVQFDDTSRQLTLSRGEAYFQVAKDPSRPFIVVAGSRKVIALGTAFAVRREDPEGGAFAVTLVEGQVAVESVGDPTATAAPRQVVTTQATSDRHVLKPGERLRFTGAAPGVVDMPAIDRVTAWRRGLLIFDDVTLRDAAAEFNRYGTVKINASGAAGDLRVGGVFRIGDAAVFAESMVRAHHLHSVTRDQEISLSR